MLTVSLLSTFCYGVRRHSFHLDFSLEFNSVFFTDHNMATSGQCLFNQRIYHQNSTTSSSNSEETFSGCEGGEQDCQDLCGNTTDFPATEGVESKMEYLLLQYGCYELKPFNLFNYAVCDSHSKIIESRKITCCSICRPVFSRKKSSRSDQRVITKQHAVAIWKTFRKSFFR